MSVGSARRRQRTRGSSKTISDSYVVKYNAVSADLTTGAGVTEIASNRLYTPGFTSGLASVPAGVQLASLYNVGNFAPGTHVKWVPSVSATTAGRVILAYLTNPEDVVTYEAATVAGKLAIIQSCANMEQHPIWQEFTYNIPTTLRRKMFDTNSTMASSVDVYDRSVQGALIWYISAPQNTNCGCLVYHDVVRLQGLSSVAN